MYKKLLSMLVIVLLAFNTIGCGTDENIDDGVAVLEPLESTEETSIQEETQFDEELMQEIEMYINGRELTEELTFADLSRKRFEFCVGAGGWSEEFTIDEDGAFSGVFHSSKTEVIGEGYADGTLFYSSYAGDFTDLTKINDYTFQMKLTNICYTKPLGMEEISENVRWVYTDSYCLSGEDTFLLYLPGTPISELSEEVYSWIAWMNESETELTRMVIVNETKQYGIYSINLTTPLEDAQYAFEECRKVYDYYGELCSEAATTAEMVEYTYNTYYVADKCLNYIWGLIREHVDEDAFKPILEEQRAWIVEKEKRADEAAAEYEGGSFSSVCYNDVLSYMTYERCEELIEYLK